MISSCYFDFWLQRYEEKEGGYLDYLIFGLKYLINHKKLGFDDAGYSFILYLCTIKKRKNKK